MSEMSGPNSYQLRFSSEREFYAGSVFSVREFRWSGRHGGLTGRNFGSWTPGEMVAECSRRVRLEGPTLVRKWSEYRGGGYTVHMKICDGTDLATCTCGFYGYWTVDAMLADMNRAPYSDSRVNIPKIVGVVEHYGETLVGELGVRSRKARVRGLAIMPSRWTYTNITVQQILAVWEDSAEVRDFRYFFDTYGFLEKADDVVERWAKSLGATGRPEL